LKHPRGPAGIVDAEAEQGSIGGILIERGVIDDQQLATPSTSSARPRKILVDMVRPRAADRGGCRGGRQAKPADAIKVDTGGSTA
jgi:hypothetical protein